MSELERIKELLADSPKGLTIEEVSKKLQLNRATAAKYLNNMVISGQADMRSLGPAKLFYATQRLPLNNLISLSSDLILIVDQDLFVRDVNESFLRYFKISKDELKGKKLDQSVIVQYFSREHLVAIENALGGTETVQEIHLEPTDGSYFKMKFIPLVFERGEQAAAIILEDITEMKRYQKELEARVGERTAELLATNEELRKESALNLAILNTAHAAIFIQDIDGIILYVNRYFETLSGYTAIETLGKKVDQFLVIPEEEKIYQKILEKLRTSQSIDDIENTWKAKDGTLRSLAWSGRVIPGSGDNGEVIVIIAVDITDRKKAEEAIKKANKQILLLNSITRHDILNELTKLTGFFSLLSVKNTNKESVMLIKKAESVTEKIRRQIIFTRDYQNIGTQPPEWVNVGEIITKVLTTVDKEGIQVVNEAADLEIYTDRLIEKVFFNLIENAIRHGEHVSRILITHEQVKYDLNLVVEDDGIGIPISEKEEIFQHGHGKNTGYGLFLVREILSITGLSIRETGKPAGGARFEITVPRGQYRLVNPS
ncbi:MAG TPA: PAS domain S-box protein [Methanoregulaceae archaeon]|nr:PAS domain S-box protein [Methanoregulaceae archaeon]